MKFLAWLGLGEWSPDAGNVEAIYERDAAESFARSRTCLDEGGRLDVVVSVVTADRPHRQPTRWRVELRTKVEQIVRVVANVSRHRSCPEN